MAKSIRLALVGEFSPSFLPHTKTDEALGHVEAALDVEVNAEWLSTTEFLDDAPRRLAQFDALWVAPGSPYKNMRGALEAIRYAREGNIPTLGTCGGCQHMVIEFARHVLGFSDAEHAEYDPYASNLFVTPLSCSLVGKAMEVHIDPQSVVAKLYGRVRVQEQYYCNFGINPSHQQDLHEGGLRIVGRDLDGEARILAVPDRRFYLATLFVPQLTSTRENPHPIVLAFVRAAIEAASTRSDVAGY